MMNDECRDRGIACSVLDYLPLSSSCIELSLSCIDSSGLLHSGGSVCAPRSGNETPPPPPLSLQWRGLCRVLFSSFPPDFFFLGGVSIGSLNMGKKEEEEIIRIAKKMDKMAQKKNGVNECLHLMFS